MGHASTSMPESTGAVTRERESSRAGVMTKRKAPPPLSTVTTRQEDLSFATNDHEALCEEIWKLTSAAAQQQEDGNSARKKELLVETILVSLTTTTTASSTTTTTTTEEESAITQETFLLDDPQCGEMILSFLLKHMTLSSLMRIFKWISSASSSLTQLNAFHRSLDQLMQKNNDKVLLEHAETIMEKLYESLQLRALKDLRTQEKILHDATKDGPPRFSWSMPHAKSSCRALEDFLRGPTEGPTIIKVDGGNQAARRLATVHCRRMAESDHLQASGYSAQIYVTGSNALIRVKKTKDYYNAIMKNYCQKTTALHGIQDEIRKLGGSVLGPKPARPRPGPPPRKRIRKNLPPIPPGEEIIEIL